jgi:hypothetical protein
MVMKRNNKRTRRLDSAAWSAARFSEIYTQLKENKNRKSEALQLIHREVCILLRRLFLLWLFFPTEEDLPNK